MSGKRDLSFFDPRGAFWCLWLGFLRRGATAANQADGTKMAMAGTFALDTVQRIGNRFDAVQDHQRAQIAAAADKAEAPRVEGGVADGEARERDTDQAVVERLDAALASEIRNDKALPSIKQLHDALQTIKEARVGASVLVSGSGLAQGAGDAAAGRGDQAALAELMAVARLTYATYGVLLESILQQAESFNDQAWFWTEVEDNLSQTFTYLVQSTLNLLSSHGDCLPCLDIG